MVRRVLLARRSVVVSITRNVAAMASAFSVSACTVGPAYQRPDMPMTPFRNALAANVGAGSKSAIAASDETWWNGFGDPELSRIIIRVLAQNLDLAGSNARVAQARAVAQEAGARLLPSGQLMASGTPEHQSERTSIGRLASAQPGYNRNKTLYDIGIGASWEVDLSGGLRRASQAAQDEMAAAEADDLGVRVSVTAEAADAYFQARGYQVRLKLALNQVDADTHLLKLVQLRMEEGASFDRELSQAQAVVSQASASIPPLRVGLEAQLNRLDVLMGTQPGTYATEMAQQSAAPAIPSNWQDLTPQRMLRRRPDIIASERRLAATNAQIGVAISQYYPKLSLSGLLGFDSLGQGFSPSRLFSSAAFQPEAVAGIQWRLFDFGRVDAEVKEAKGANQLALAQYRQTVLRAAEEVEDALMSFAQLQQQDQQISFEVAALRRSREASETAYTAGAIPLTDVLDADRLLLSAQDELATAQYAQARSAVQIFRAMGGGWPPQSSESKADPISHHPS